MTVTGSAAANPASSTIGCSATRTSNAAVPQYRPSPGTRARVRRMRLALIARAEISCARSEAGGRVSVSSLPVPHSSWCQRRQGMKPHSSPLRAPDEQVALARRRHDLEPAVAVEIADRRRLHHPAVGELRPPGGLVALGVDGVHVVDARAGDAPRAGRRRRGRRPIGPARNCRSLTCARERRQELAVARVRRRRR